MAFAVPLSSSPQPNILIVDDTPDNLRILSDMLSLQGYEVRKALSGNMALKSIQALHPDLILLDIMMPGIDGYEVCRRLKANPATLQIPIIFLSALNATEEKVKAFKLGAADYVTKPFQFEEIVARIEHQLHLCRLQQQLAAQNALLEAEKSKAEALLLNILPEPIVAQLRDHPHLGQLDLAHSANQVILAQFFPTATILFADIANFTDFATQVSPRTLVSLLNQIFSQFDHLADRYHLEKIKTIGDAYMVAGGIPVPQNDHAQAIAQMAIEMQTVITHFKTTTGKSFQLRIGINTGPVIAGILGIKKFSYDLWGDAVNIASRMEFHGEPGRIQVSETTYEMLKDEYVFSPRGMVHVKGKGMMQTYWLLGKR